MNRWLGQFVRHLPPGAFAFVMATGIVSSAFALIGWQVVSMVLLIVAIAGGVLLAVALLWRLIAFLPDALRDAQNPAVAFGYLTLVAAINVVGIRLFSPQAPGATIALALISVPIWVIMVYGIPAVLMLRSRPTSAIADADGSWFLWVVATQSIATAAATIAQHERSEVLSAVAVALWGIGVMLYLMLATLVTLKLLTSANSPHSLNPSYWIYMGATAITVFAGSRILVLPADLPIMRVSEPVVSGLTFVLWAFGMWWIPLLVVFGVWRYLLGREPVRYESGFWSIVFPLGMFAVASMHFGRAAHLSTLVTIGEIGAVISGVAWLAALAAMVLAVLWKKPSASAAAAAAGSAAGLR
ncbi:MAG: tellurite resistance/C4-dicarboxylate transporter family protein [Microbacteriaceae bacterium]